MPLDLPTLSTIANRTRADIKSQLPNSDPYQPASMLNTLAVMEASRIRELYDQALIIKQDALVTTADEQSLDDKGEVYGMTLNSATEATGSVLLTGTAGTSIPLATEFQSSTSETYISTTSGTITTSAISISSLSRSGSVVTATTSTEHNLGTGMSVIIAGAVETDYNGTFTITVTTLYNFQYTISATPSSPATGTITATHTSALVSVISENTGQDTNVTGGSNLTLTTPIASVDNTCYTTFTGLTGGTDIETYDEFRERLLFRIQNPNTPYNAVQIKLTAKEISGVTRVWVYEPDEVTTSQTATSIACVANDYPLITLPSAHNLFDGMQVTITGASPAAFNGTFKVLVISSTTLLYYSSTTTGTASGTITVEYSDVQLGQTKILFTRDNDASIIPSAGEITEVRNAILAIKPANTADVDVIVEAPVENSTAFTFTALSPNTAGIQSSIQTNLENLFYNADVGDTITEIQYQTAIQNSFDTSSGAGVSTFTLSAPSGDITQTYNELATLGTLTFP